jgi:aminoglycoside phosphotransferase (APT) family kinase protein
MPADPPADRPASGRAPPPETVEVRPAHRFPTERLEALLLDKLDARLTGIRQMGGGQSNPTFVLSTDKGDYVLRKQPPGKLLPSAHAVDREYRVLSALARTDVPVPRTFLFCDDLEITGTPFYIMERMRGRVFWSQTLPDAAREERRPIYFGMADALARLHKVDYKAVGLADFGKPGSYFSRQIGRWTKQWENSRTRDNPSIDKLADWLPRNIPEAGDDETVICHGDFRFDNMMFHASQPRVIAIFDWELSTLGHPLADLAYFCMPYHLPANVSGMRGLIGLDLADLGIPSEDELLAAYCERSGRSEVPNWSYFLAFSLFRMAAILQGVAARAVQGNASSADARMVGGRAGMFAEAGKSVAQAAEPGRLSDGGEP